MADLGTMAVGGSEGGINAREEFLASYFASKAVLPVEPVMANYYSKRSTRAVALFT
jgi:hypothetical protein